MPAAGDPLRRRRARPGDPIGFASQSDLDDNVWSPLPLDPTSRPLEDLGSAADPIQWREPRPLQRTRAGQVRPAPQATAYNNTSYTTTGALAGAGSYISWTGTVTDRVANDAGVPYTGTYSIYAGSMAAMTAVMGSTNWSNPALTALGAPYADVGLGTFVGTLNTTAVETIAYAFSSPIPAGQSFELVDAGATYVEYAGVETYTISATYQNAAVNISGWTFTVMTPTGTAPASNIVINAATGTITVRSYVGATWPDSVIVITPNTPVSTLSVTANTIPYDFWAVTLPHVPSALIFQSVNTTPAQAGLVATWQVNGATVGGGGAIANPGPNWTYEGTGDFQGNGGTDILFRSENGQIVYWAVSGVTIFNSMTLGNPGANWAIAGVGNFNSDGLSDILFEDSAGDLALWFINTGAIVGGGVIGNPGVGWSFLATGDFDGSGHNDILFENASGVFADWMMRGTTITSSNALGWRAGAVVFVGVGDFNGDNRTDVLFKNPALGQIYGVDHVRPAAASRRRRRCARRA